jgi:hypothetical protein
MGGRHGKIHISKEMSSFVSGNTPSALYFENDPTVGHYPPHNKLWCLTLEAAGLFALLRRIGGAFFSLGLMNKKILFSFVFSW